MAFIFTDLLNRAPANISTNVADARNWIQDNVKQVRNRQLFAKGGSDRMQSKIALGNMYMFLYDPKTKEKLPYYDRFPLIFPIESAPGGFLGLNLHYISPIARAKLMDALWDYTTGSDDNRRMIATYKVLKASSRLRYYKPCVKRYLNNHVQSSFVKINPDEWNIAMFLPTERFSKASKNTVYADSNRKF